MGGDDLLNIEGDVLVLTFFQECSCHGDMDQRPLPGSVSGPCLFDVLDFLWMEGFDGSIEHGGDVFDQVRLCERRFFRLR